MEKQLQTEIIKFLKSQGAYVVKTKPGMGTPTGCPDILFFLEGAWGAIEVKAARNSPFQPGQQLTLKKLKSWNPFVYIAYPANWQIIKEELSALFF